MTNRITPYEAGWLSMLVRRGICSEKDAREAQKRGSGEWRDGDALKSAKTGPQLLDAIRREARSSP